MHHPFILAITGPAGSGKSTVASRLAKEVDQCVNIDADHVKHMIVNGFIYGNQPEGISQWQLLAKNFQQAGYNVIINGYINEPAWENIQCHVVLDYKVLLLPHIDTVTQRDAGRQEEYRMGSETIREHHDYFSGARFYDDFVKVDSTSHSIDETVDTIEKIVNL